jgi:translation initiation factor IF-2
VLRQLTEEEKAARQRALSDSKVAAELARKKAEEDAARRAIEEARLAVEREAAAKRAAEEEARRKSEEETKRRSEEEAARRLPEGVAPGSRDLASQSDDDDDRRKRRPGAAPARAPAAKPGASGRTTTDDRRRGKLTVTRALDENERVRSLASYRRSIEREKRQHQQREAPKKVVRDVVVPETITVQDLANRMAERGVDVIKALMKMGVMATINQVIDADTAELLVTEFGHNLKRVAEADVEIGLVGAADTDENKTARPPVVTIMGHVDHGKTSLLDALRSTDVAAGEAGGITQHIGAYQVELKSGRKITFLDTPGHEAFTAMRARGGKAADVVVLVVAADDSVMPQTIEAIRHAKAANVPIIVAVNKVDKADADPTKVRRELLQYEIAVEEMGGETLSVDVSAKTRQGLDKLEEAILLQAEILDLKANPDRSAEGMIVEAKLDKGRGPVATTLVQRGTLKVGDIVVAGSEWGRVRALLDDRGRNVREAGPSFPVEILGLGGVPEAGDEFQVVENEARAREVVEFRQRRARDARAVSGARGTLEQMFARVKAGESKDLPVVIKADVQGSVEAIVGSAQKLSNDEVSVRVLHAAVGGITESDVILAQASKALIIGFNVRANKQARDLAQRDGVDIRYYSIIYNVVDDLKAMLSGLLAPEVRENFLGYAEIRKVFDMSKAGKVAGCMVTEGQVKRGAKVRLLRDNVVIHEGTLSTLRRFKDEVREVKSGFECGMAFENYQDIREGDQIECFELESVARTL